MTDHLLEELERADPAPASTTEGWSTSAAGEVVRRSVRADLDRYVEIDLPSRSPRTTLLVAAAVLVIALLGAGAALVARSGSKPAQLQPVESTTVDPDADEVPVVGGAPTWIPAGYRLVAADDVGPRHRSSGIDPNSGFVFMDLEYDDDAGNRLWITSARAASPGDETLADLDARFWPTNQVGLTVSPVTTPDGYAVELTTLDSLRGLRWREDASRLGIQTIDPAISVDDLSHILDSLSITDGLGAGRQIDLDRFCALADRSSFPPDYFGSEQHVADLDDEIASAPDALVADLSTIRYGVSSLRAEVGVADPESWPPSMQDANVRLSVSVSQVCLDGRPRR